MCHRAGQGKSAQILLRLQVRGLVIALHRDVFGDLVFPLQVVVGLDVYGTDDTGGEVPSSVEQRPRAQSRRCDLRGPGRAMAYLHHPGPTAPVVGSAQRRGPRPGRGARPA